MASTAITTNDPVTKKAWEEKLSEKYEKNHMSASLWVALLTHLSLNKQNLQRERG